ncbi:unnamed protein product, partial [marine sediment metagenome]
SVAGSVVSSEHPMGNGTHVDIWFMISICDALAPGTINGSVRMLAAVLSVVIVKLMLMISPGAPIIQVSHRTHIGFKQ